MGWAVLSKNDIKLDGCIDSSLGGAALYIAFIDLSDFAGLKLNGVEWSGVVLVRYGLDLE